MGIHVQVEELLDNRYIKTLYTNGNKNISAIFLSYFKRLFYLLKINDFDLLWIEKELFPWLPSWAEVILNKIGVPFVVDYDDAIFHQYDLHHSLFIRKILGHKIDSVMKNSALVTAGNEYLAERARSSGAKTVEIIPTVIDLNRYNVEEEHNDKVFTIGWIGAPSTVKYLKLIEPALSEFFKNKPIKSAKLLIVGGEKIDLGAVPLEIREWTEETEVTDISVFDVGIMPLPDEPWERGKCGYKLIQYMACGVPVIASPVGVNKNIVKNGVNGFLASNTEEWVQALNRLIEDKNLKTTMGKRGRSEVENKYCIQVTLPKLTSLLKAVGKKGN